MMTFYLCIVVCLLLITNTVAASENPTTAFEKAVNAVSLQGKGPDGIGSLMERGKVNYVSIEQLSDSMQLRVTENLAAQRTGYVPIADKPFIYRDTYKDRLRQEQDIKSNLRVALADINQTELNTYQCEGIIPDGPTKTGPWTDVIRVFRRADGALLMLREWDYVAAGGALLRINELMNVKVREMPAMLLLKKSPSGWVRTELSWASDQKSYRITVWDDISSPRNAKKYDATWLMHLASTLY